MKTKSHRQELYKLAWDQAMAEPNKPPCPEGWMVDGGYYPIFRMVRNLESLAKQEGREWFEASSHSIGWTVGFNNRTIYRCLNKMERDGLIKCHERGNSEQQIPTTYLCEVRP